jgi:hypothetical protein
MRPETDRLVTVENLDQLNSTLTAIKDQVAGFKPKKKMDWIAFLALTVSIITLYSTGRSDRRNVERQEEIQAYSNWQSFLQFAASNPELANGFDTINGKSVAWYSDTANRIARKNDKRGDSIYIKYAWFVADAFGSAESVYKLQPSDTAWINTVVDALWGHKVIFKATIDSSKSYDSSFIRLVRASFMNKPSQGKRS